MSACLSHHKTGSVYLSDLTQLDRPATPARDTIRAYINVSTTTTYSQDDIITYLYAYTYRTVYVYGPTDRRTIPTTEYAVPSARRRTCYAPLRTGCGERVRFEGRRMPKRTRIKG